jgi:hypothetical protein
METTHSHAHSQEHVMHTHAHTDSHLKTFYICLGILTFTIVFLQPLAMLAVIFAQALLQ